MTPRLTSSPAFRQADGHERQRLCRQYQRKRELFKDELLAGFYHRFRAQVRRDGSDRFRRARASAAPAASGSSYRVVNGAALWRDGRRQE